MQGCPQGLTTGAISGDSGLACVSYVMCKLCGSVAHCM